MQTQMELTAAEARTATSLWRLRQQFPSDAHSSVELANLAQLIGAVPEDLAQIGRKARRALPSNLVASDSRFSSLEAETILAIHAARGTAGKERLPLSAVAGAIGAGETDFELLVRDARERLATAESIIRAPQGPVPERDLGGVAVGEHPRSWQIMWSIVAALAVILGVAFLMPH